MVVKKLNTVERMSEAFSDTNLEGTILIACQHILKTNYQMFLSLFEKGLNPESIFLMGKCYSNDKEALALFVKSGINVHKNSEAFDSHEEFDKQYDKNVEEFFRTSFEIAKKKAKKVIILDDGGHMISIANKILKTGKGITGIEQTSSGYNRIKRLKLKFPVINVARSNAKLNHESPIVADLFVSNLDYELKTLKKEVEKILIIGKGPIGISIAEKLKKEEIKFYDLDSDKSDFSSENELKKNLKSFDLIIGCSGEKSFKTQYFNYLKNEVVLVSASSSDREFSAKDLRKLDDRYFKCHQNRTIRGIHLLNSGFPLTFTAHKMGANGKEIQLTRALIFSSILTAARINSKKGIIEVENGIQDKILLEFHRSKNE